MSIASSTFAFLTKPNSGSSRKPLRFRLGLRLARASSSAVASSIAARSTGESTAPPPELDLDLELVMSIASSTFAFLTKPNSGSAWKPLRFRLGFKYSLFSSPSSIAARSSPRKGFARDLLPGPFPFPFPLPLPLLLPRPGLGPGAPESSLGPLLSLPKKFSVAVLAAVLLARNVR